MLKAKLLSLSSVRKNIPCNFRHCFGVYTPAQYALSCKMWKFQFYVNRKKSKYYLKHAMLKKKIALNKICQKKHTMTYSTLFWSIYTNSVCSLM